MTSGEEDFTQRSKAFVDLKYVDGEDIATPSVTGCVPVSVEHVVEISHEEIKGTALTDPTVSACVPISVENDAIAYNSTTDRFKVDVEAMTVGTIDVDVSNEWARELGQVDLARVLGSALAHANPVIVRLTDGSAFIDPRDVSDRAARLLGVVYGSEDQLQQRATTKELIVQIQHQGAEKDPTQIRALTSSDIVTVEQATAASLKATVTQASAVREISDVTKTATRKQFSDTWAAAGNKTAWDPAADHYVRLKIICLELSADVDLGYRWGAAGTIYYLRTTAGPIVVNLIGSNDEGDVDEILYLYASGACTVKGHFAGEELS